MDLMITNSNYFFQIKGALNQDNLSIFQNEFNNIFEKTNKLTISIEGLQSMDRAGVDALTKLHEEALDKNKSFSIVGFGCKDLYNHFKACEAA